MTTKAIELTATRILGNSRAESKEKLKQDIKSNPNAVRNWVRGNISFWALKTSLEHPAESATTPSQTGLDVEVYSPDLGEDSRLLIAELERQLSA
ncbi:MAG: hypothetical protein V4467_02610 [Patescibacteria group bacterium]